MYSNAVGSLDGLIASVERILMLYYLVCHTSTAAPVPVPSN